MQLLTEVKRGKLFILSAPAGTGKTTLVKMLVNEFSSVIQSISYTSRPTRVSELEGRDYHFITEEEFKKKIEMGDFLEYAQVFSHFYGTDKEWVEKRLSSGYHVFLVIDTQGAMQLQARGVDAVFIFIYPPSLEELKIRLQNRKTETDAIIEERLAWALKEMEIGKKYDYQIVNDNLNIAYQVLRSVVIAENHRREKDEGRRLKTEREG